MEKYHKYINIEVLYILIVILYLARPAEVFVNIDPRINLIGFCLYILPAIYLAYRYGVEFKSKFFAIMAVYSIWVGIHISIDPELKLLSYLLIYCHIFVAYVLVRSFHTELFCYFWRIVTVLTAIDIVLWALCHCVSLDFLEQISILAPSSDTSSASFIIFNSPGIRYEGLGMLGMMRNCGFAWEPGLFGSILVLAAFFNLEESNYQFRGNYSLYIILFGIITTFSTTAYTALLVLFSLRSLLSMKSGITASRILGLTLLVGSILLANNLPFMNEKIQNDVNMSQTLSGDKRNVEWVEKEGEQRTVKRSEGLFLDYLNFQASPVWGYGIDPVNSYVSREITPYLVTSNDLTSLLAKWGIVFTLLLVILFSMNSYFLRNNIYCGNNSFLCIYLVIAVSYSLSLCALAICFLLYRFFEDTALLEKQDYYETEDFYEYDDIEEGENQKDGIEVVPYLTIH